VTRPLTVMLASVVFGAALGCGEDTASPTGPEEPAAPTLATTTAVLAFRQVSGGETHTCGITTDNRAYCWGLNYYGQLGDGSFGAAKITRPVAAVADRRFLEIRVGINFTCALTTGSQIYCWGLNTEGRLGIGSTQPYSLEPALLAGGRRYRQLRVGSSHGCAITLADVTFCWGRNDFGQVGDGTTINRRSPVRVVGGITFRAVSAGSLHTCGLNLARRAYCWGRNSNGQLGLNNSITQLRPAGVVGGRAFNVLSAGAWHTCGVGTDAKAYCWGWNRYGQLGDGTTNRRSQPTLVAGGMSFSGVSPGGGHTCAVTPGKKAYCWGWNNYGEVGDGTYGGAAMRLTPTAVAGGLLFDRVIAAIGSSHSCGVSTAERAYCWGDNQFGQLGDGSTSVRSTPVPVAQPM
jgi:alpha-tubulin suppressor-like RCC1 family protein